MTALPPLSSWAHERVLLCDQAEVKYDAEVLTPDEIARGVTGLGYKCRHTRTVKPGTGRAGQHAGGEGGGGGQRSALDMEVTGMSCTSCSGKVNRRRPIDSSPSHRSINQPTPLRGGWGLAYPTAMYKHHLCSMFVRYCVTKLAVGLFVCTMGTRPRPLSPSSPRLASPRVPALLLRDATHRPQRELVTNTRSTIND